MELTQGNRFCILILEIRSEGKPFPNVPHEQLFLQIYKGSRPQVTRDTLQFYRDRMQKCWHINPTERPIADQVFRLTESWHRKSTLDIKDQ